MAVAAPPRLALRADLLAQLAAPQTFDVTVVGGGATGLGVALDAAARGLRVLLLEAHDFAKGTSSRSTKLVHGGVRYLAQGQLAFVRESLKERALLLAHAPHLAQPLAFVIPTYRWWDKPFYGAGLKLYDALARSAGLGATELLSPQQTQALLPTVQTQGPCGGLKGGVKYWDGQFNDARLAITLARTAAAHGALMLNYVRVNGLLYDQGRVTGLTCTDAETGKSYRVRSRCVVNATGVWVNELCEQDDSVRATADAAGVTGPRSSAVTPSQGVHLVVGREFLPGDAALMIPKTADGRVLFALPWLGKVVLGTTDTPRDDMPLEPLPMAHEVDFILTEAGRYLSRPPTRRDVCSVWAGLRPLAHDAAGDRASTQGLSREHRIWTSPSGLLSVTGGKWTTYRAMAQDVMEACFAHGLLDSVGQRRGVTEHLRLLGGDPADGPVSIREAEGIHSYGSEREYVLAFHNDEPELAPGLTSAMVRFAARHEYARTVEDVLARRSRLLFLDAGLAKQVAPKVAMILAQETGVTPQAEQFDTLAANYLRLPTKVS
jgi:glycerol-3-phosphate dehydrogenase